MHTTPHPAPPTCSARLSVGHMYLAAIPTSDTQLCLRFFFPCSTSSSSPPPSSASRSRSSSAELGPGLHQANQAGQRRQARRQARVRWAAQGSGTGKRARGAAGKKQQPRRGPGPAAAASARRLEGIDTTAGGTAASPLKLTCGTLNPAAAATLPPSQGRPSGGSAARKDPGRGHAHRTAPAHAAAAGAGRAGGGRTHDHTVGAMGTGT